MKPLTLFVIGLSLLVFTSYGQPLNGTYSINSGLPTGGTNFNSFSSLAAALSSYGISGNVIITVAPGSGPYVEQVNFNPIPGIGPNATVFIEGNGELIKAATTTTDRHVVRLSFQTYFTINNLHIERDLASAGGFYGIHIYGSGNYITISNCTADILGTTSTLTGGYIASGSTTSILETGDFHNITFIGNKSTGGGYGISLFGLISNLASNISITNNELYDFHSNGVYLRETNGAIISGNTLEKNSSNVTSANAIQLAQAANVNAQIFNNFITISQVNNGSMTFRGIYLFNGTGHKVYNNVIHSVMLTSGDFTGIEVRTGGTAPEIYYNTISIDNTVNTSGNLAGIKEELSNTLSIIRNNNISITQPTSGNKSALILGSISNVGTAFNSNYNILWVPGGHVGQKGGEFSTPVYYTSLADWQSASGQDLQSAAIDPLPATLSLPVPTNPVVDNLGTSIVWITTDVLGVVRSNPPDIGAFEFSPGPPSAPACIFGDTVVCDNDTIQTFWVDPVAGASTYTWAVTGSMQIINGQGSGTIQVNTGVSGGNISVYATNLSGNSPTVNLAVTVVVHTIASLNLPVSVLCNTSPPIILSGGSPSGGNYSGTAVSAGVFSPVMAGIGQHHILYTYLDTNGCTDTASAILVVQICPLVAEVTRDTNLMLIPNPFYGSCDIIIPLSIKESILFIYSIDGCLQRVINISNQNTRLELDGLSKGMYYLLLTDNHGRTYSTKAVVAE